MKLSRTALSIAIIAALLLAIAGPGARFGLWHFGTGLLLMRVALFVGLAAALFALVLLVIPKTRAGSGVTLAIAMLVGLGAAWIPYNGYRTAMSLPFIHDVTTDTSNPPTFVAVVPLRVNASNPPEYAGEEVAKQQRQGYPDIQTLALQDPPAEALRKAQKTAEDMGFEIVAVVPQEGRIEATATTFWFGFKDDVVIRIVADGSGSGSRFDMRSKSRVGGSDVGANAARIRRFMTMLKEQTRPNLDPN